MIEVVGHRNTIAQALRWTGTEDNQKEMLEFLDVSEGDRDKTIVLDPDGKPVLYVETQRGVLEAKIGDIITKSLCWFNEYERDASGINTLIHQYKRFEVLTEYEYAQDYIMSYCKGE